MRSPPCKEPLLYPLHVDACPPFSLLPINEDADTVAVNGFLLGRHIEHVVVGKALVLAHDHLGVFYCGTHLTHVNPLLGQLGTHSETYNMYDILCFQCYDYIYLIIIRVLYLYMCGFFFLSLNIYIFLHAI